MHNHLSAGEIELLTDANALFKQFGVDRDFLYCKWQQFTIFDIVTDVQSIKYEMYIPVSKGKEDTGANKNMF